MLTFSITVWYRSASIQNKNMLEGLVQAASKITCGKLLSIELIYTTHTLRKATTIIFDFTHLQTTSSNLSLLGSGSDPSN